MKKHLFLILIIFTIRISSFGQPSVVAYCEYFDDDWPIMGIPYLNCELFEDGAWTLVFSDEFESNQIDRDIWHTCEDGWNRVHSGTNNDYIHDNNVILEDGKLRLAVMEQPDYYPVKRFYPDGTPYDTLEWYRYTSGWAEPKMTFKYGFFEIKCKIPDGEGLWPSYWFWGLTNSNGYITEIDAVESDGSNPNSHKPEIHSWIDGTQNKSSCPTEHEFSDDWYEEPHIFSIEWDEFRIVHRVDGVAIRIDYTYIDMYPHGLDYCINHVPGFYEVNPYRPLAPTDIRLTMGLKDDYASSMPNRYFDIEYIKIWRRNNSHRDKEICVMDFDNKPAVRTAKTFTIGGQDCFAELKNREFLFLFATERIIHYPGFIARLGSRYTAKITASSKGNSDSPMIVPIQDDTLSNESDLSDEQKNRDFTNENSIENLSSDLVSPKNNFVAVYPNPNNGIFTINTSRVKDDIIKIQLYSLNNMHIIQDIHPSSNLIKCDLSNCRSGVYTIRIITQKQIITKMMIKF